MRYLIIYIEDEVQKVFYSDWFDVENNYNENLDMVVIDLHTNKYFSKVMKWKDIDFDHL